MKHYALFALFVALGTFAQGQMTCLNMELAGCEQATGTFLAGDHLHYSFDAYGDLNSWSSDIFVEITDGFGNCVYFAGYNSCGTTSNCALAGMLGEDVPASGTFVVDLLGVLATTGFWEVHVTNAYGTSVPVSYQLSSVNPASENPVCGTICPEGAQWYLPNNVGDGPAILACEAPENYTVAEYQGCADAIIFNDPYCVDTNWDNICQEAYDLCSGCTNPSACNFSIGALEDDGSCLLDVNANGVCDVDEVYGCTDESACNYDASATTDGSLSGQVVTEICTGAYGPGMGYFPIDAETYLQNDALFINGETVIHVDGVAYIIDHVSASVYGNECNPTTVHVHIVGGVINTLFGGETWMLSNTNPCLLDLDSNGICDVDDIDGCMDPADCNYNPEATSEGSFFMEVVGCNENQSFPHNYVMVSRDHFEQNFSRFVNRETILSVDGVDYLFHHHSLSNCDEILLYISPVSAPGGLSFGMNDQVLSPGDLIEVRNTPCQSLSFCTECDDAYVAQSVALSTTLLPDVPEVNVWTENYVYTSLKNSSTNVSYLLTGDEIAEFKQGGTTRYYELTTEGSDFENGIVYFDGDLEEDFEGGFLPGSFVRFFIPSEDCSGIGCTNPSACNFSSVHVIDDGSCLLDVNANGVCDVDEVYGCTDDEACNYSPDATTEGTLSGTVIMNECDNQYQFNYFGIDADVYFQNQNLFIPGESMIEVSGQMYLLNSVSLAVGNECNPTNVLVFIGGNVSGLSFAEPLVGGEAWTLTNGPCASETYCGTCGNDYLDQSVARATSYLDEDEPPTWRGNYLLVDEPLLLNTEGSFAVELEQDGLVRFYYIYGYNTETGFIYLSDNNFCSELSAPLTSCSAFLLEDFEGGFRPGSIVRFIAPCCDDLNQNGTCDAEEGCTYSAADNYNALATVDDGSCQFASSNCPADIVPDGFVQLNDLLALLQQYGLLCSEP
ncbi:MAG: hypothetical protein O3C18_09760 [Bacteroidetes bacterium]|nr:hypothetical protein [Bacteroidota bacterium]